MDEQSNLGAPHNAGFWPSLRWRLAEANWVRITLISLALILLLATGTNLLMTPAYEVTYDSTRLPVSTNANETTFFYTLDLGNTGRRTLSDVTVTFSTTACARILTAPSFENFGVSERPVTSAPSAKGLAYSLGPLEPDKRVTVTLLMTYGKGEAPLPWNEVAQIDPAEGVARPGAPAMTLFARVFYSIFL